MTGIVVTMIGLALLKVGIQYAAGGVPAIGKPEYGSLLNWSVALVVIVVTLGLKFFTRGTLSVAAVLLGLVAGYVVAFALGMVSFDAVGRAAVFALPNPMHFGVEFSAAAVIGFCLMAFISAIETVGDVSGITKGGANREATDAEVKGATFADGVGSALAGMFGALPNTSFSQNVGLIAITGVMSRHVVTCGAIFLVIAGLVPKVGGPGLDHSDRGARGRRHRDVRHGGLGGHQHALRRELEPAQHGHIGAGDVDRVRPATRARRAAAPADDCEDSADLRAPARRHHRHRSESCASRRTRRRFRRFLIERA